MRYRGLIHFHSKYSYDSMLSIKQVVKFALKNNLNFLILTDHDTINGSLKLKEYIKQNNLDIEILVAAEYNTEYGDIIALNIENEITDMNFNNFIKEVKKQNGLLLFPHPYKGHKNIEYIADKVDLIEVFNARTDDASNQKAFQLSQKYNKNIYYASDAHTSSSLKNAIITFDKLETLTNSILFSKIDFINKKKSFIFEVIWSQFIKSYKQKKFKLFMILGIKTIKIFLMLRLFKRI